MIAVGSADSPIGAWFVGDELDADIVVSEGEYAEDPIVRFGGIAVLVSGDEVAVRDFDRRSASVECSDGFADFMTTVGCVVEPLWMVELAPDESSNSTRRTGSRGVAVAWLDEPLSSAKLVYRTSKTYSIRKRAESR